LLVRAPLVKLQLPAPLAVVVPKEPFTEEVTLTVEFASAVPMKVGVVSEVVLSVLELPVSDPALRSGVLGAEGVFASIASAFWLMADVKVFPAFPPESVKVTLIGMSLPAATSVPLSVTVNVAV